MLEEKLREAIKEEVKDLITAKSTSISAQNLDRARQAGRAEQYLSGSAEMFVQLLEARLGMRPKVGDYKDAMAMAVGAAQHAFTDICPDCLAAIAAEATRSGLFSGRISGDGVSDGHLLVKVRSGGLSMSENLCELVKRGLDEEEENEAKA